MAETHVPQPGKGRARWWVAIVAVAAIVAAVVAWRYYAVRVSTDDAQIEGHITPVAARVGGTVESVSAVDNQYVEAGALLVQLDKRDYEVALTRAQADLAEATAAAQAARTGVPVTTATTASQLQGAESDLATGEARLRTARARLLEAQAKDAQAARDLERLQGLLAKDEISQQEFDQSRLARDTARAGFEAAQSAVHEAEAGVSAAEAHRTQTRTAPQQVEIVRARAASAEARVQQTQAALQRAQLDLDHTTVKAAVSGIVSKKTVELGQIVQAGQPLLALVPLEDVWVTANFKESQLRDIRPGQHVDVEVDAFGGRSYLGHVDSVAPATGAKFSLLPPENATGNFVKVVQRVPVKIVFEKGQDPDHQLRPGMSVTPTVRIR